MLYRRTITVLMLFVVVLGSACASAGTVEHTPTPEPTTELFTVTPTPEPTATTTANPTRTAVPATAVPTSMPAATATPTVIRPEGAPASAPEIHHLANLRPIATGRKITVESWSPDGRYLAYREHTPADLDENPQIPPGDFRVFDTEEPTPECVQIDDHRERKTHFWTSESELVYVTDAGEVVVWTVCTNARTVVTDRFPETPLDFETASPTRSTFLVGNRHAYWLVDGEMQPRQVAGTENISRHLASAAWSPDGAHVAVTSKEGTTIVIDVEQARRTQTIEAQPLSGKGSPPAPIWLSDQRFLVPATGDKGPLLVTLGGDTVQVAPEIFGVAPQPDGYTWYAYATVDESGDTSHGYHIVLSPSGAVSDYPPALLYHNETDEIEELEFRSVTGRGFTPDGRRLALTYRLGADSSERLETWLRPIDPAGSEATPFLPLEFEYPPWWSPEGKLAAADTDAGFVILVAPDGQIVAEWRSERNTSVAMYPTPWSPGGDYLVVKTYGEDDERLYLVPAPVSARSSPPATGVPPSATPASDVSIETEGMVLRNADTPVPSPTATLPPFECLDDTPIETTPPAGPLRVVYELDGKIWEWREETSESVLLFDPDELPDDTIDHALSHDGRYVAFARRPDETTFDLWLGEVETGSRRKVATLTTDDVLARYPDALDVDLIFEWVRDSHTLQYELKPELDIGPATLGVHQTTYLTDADTGRTRTIFPPAEITNVTYSPDLTQIAAMAGKAQQVRLIDATTGEVQHVIPLPLGRASRQQTMRYSPDGRMLAVFTTDGVSLIDADAGTHRDIWLVYEPIGISHYSAWPHLVWAPDSRFFYVGIAGDDDFTEVSEPGATYTVWRVDVAEATAEPINEFYGFFGSYFSPDLRYLAAWRWGRGDLSMHDLFLSDVTEGRQMLYDRGRLLFLDGWNTNGIQFLYTLRDTGEVILGHVCDEPRTLEAISPASSVEWVDSQRILALGNLPRSGDPRPLRLYTLAGETTLIARLEGENPSYHYYFGE